MKSARDLERELFQSALGAEFATSVSPPEIVIPIADDGTIDVVAIQRLEELFNTAATTVGINAGRLSQFQTRPGFAAR